MMRSVMAVGAFALCAGVAQAETFVWDWTSSQGALGGSINNAAGQFESILASYDNVSNRFTWTMTFSNTVTDAFALAVNNGPNPKGHAGELALVYFDWTDKSTSNAKVTAYAYNGKNLTDSWLDGNGNVAGNQAPDIIHSLANTSWINKATAKNVGTKRVFELDIDASTINGWTPKYPGSSPWTGMKFDNKLGLWLHTFDQSNPGVHYASNGSISNFGFNAEGWFDGSNITVVPIPTPAAMGLAGLIGVAAIRRRVAR
jgi:hypothetical protein